MKDDDDGDESSAVSYLRASGRVIFCMHVQNVQWLQVPVHCVGQRVPKHDEHSALIGDLGAAYCCTTRRDEPVSLIDQSMTATRLS